MSKRRWFFGVILICSWLGVSPALAQSPTDYIRGILDHVMAIQNNDSLSRQERGREIHQIIRSSFDFNEMSRKVLGSTYHQLSAAQRSEFLNTFGYLFQDSYTRMVVNFLKNENIKYGSASRQGSQAKVNTVIQRPNENIPVTYLMRSAGGWKLYDVIVDGVSILHTYETKFSEVIRTKGFSYLIDRMNEQRRAVE
ncbi:MAG: ABC transporter substrate-binding protein [Deltaproteobacteria bacterium]|jgi:phospholipid transport system substrate-binding protein